MEAIRLAAKAYYRNSSNEIQQLAKDFFYSMDIDGDGRISFSEFTQFLQQNGYQRINHITFEEIDANGDGYLNFMEFLSFYYIVKTRRVWCDGCRENLHTLYFTCTECFDNGNDTFDLCSICYADGRFSHHHNRFVDNFVMLLSKSRPFLASNNHYMAPIPGPPNNHSWSQSFQKLESALSIFNLIASIGGGGCSIM